MKKLKNALFIVLLLLFPFGFLLTLFEIYEGDYLMLFSLLGIFIYSLIKTIKYLRKKTPRILLMHQLVVVLMSFSLYTKYLYHSFGDYPGLVIIPLFIISSCFYLIKEKSKKTKLTTVTIVYLLLTIPLSGFYFYNSPIQYIPRQWYDRYNVSGSTPIDFPNRFYYYRTEQLVHQAYELKQRRKYASAIDLYYQAKTLEPYNPRVLFDISNAYALSNDLETALLYLDTAIMHDSTIFVLYNNRGLLHYKLFDDVKAESDYLKAIALDSTQMIVYGNLALVYYSMNMLDKACQQIQIADSLGYNENDCGAIRRIKRRCSRR